MRGTLFGSPRGNLRPLVVHGPKQRPAARQVRVEPGLVNQEVEPTP